MGSYTLSPNEEFPVPTSNLKKYKAVIFSLPFQCMRIYDQIFEDNLIVFHQRETKLHVDADEFTPARVTDGTRDYDILDDLICPELSTIDKILLAEVSDLINDIVGIPLDKLEAVVLLNQDGSVVVLYEEADDGTH